MSTELERGGFDRVRRISYTYPVVLSHRTLAVSRQDAALIRIQVPQRELARLENLFQTTSDNKLRHRLQIVLMAYRGRPRNEIAPDLGIDRRSVTRWLNISCDAGVEGLQPRTAKGNTAKIPATLTDEIRQGIIQGPAACGLDHANWTHAELADHLRKTHGILTSRSAMQRFCQRIGVRVYRPTYRYLRGDPAKQDVANQEIAALNKTRKRAKSSYFLRTKRDSRWCQHWRQRWG